MEDLIYDMKAEISNLRNNPQPLRGFMRHCRLYDHNSPRAVAPSGFQFIDFDKIITTIENSVTAAEYNLLQNTTYSSPKETIQAYVDLLTRLLNEGIFDGYFSQFNQATGIPYGTDTEYQFKSDYDRLEKELENEYGRIPFDNHHMTPVNGSIDNNGPINECTASEENIKESDKDDNSGKPYNGPLFEIKVSDPTKSALVLFHNIFKGHPDYINSNILVSHNVDDSSTLLTICVDDLKDKNIMTVIFDKLQMIKRDDD